MEAEQITDEHRRMAAHLNCDPGRPDTWPLEMIGRLIALKRHRGQERLNKELILLTWGPRHRCEKCGR